MDKLEELRNVIKQWNANRLDLFEISEPNKVNFSFRQATRAETKGLNKFSFLCTNSKPMTIHIYLLSGLAKSTID